MRPTQWLHVRWFDVHCSISAKAAGDCDCQDADADAEKQNDLKASDDLWVCLAAWLSNSAAVLLVTEPN